MLNLNVNISCSGCENLENKKKGVIYQWPGFSLGIVFTYQPMAENVSDVNHIILKLDLILFFLYNRNYFHTGCDFAFIPQMVV